MVQDQAILEGRFLLLAALLRFGEVDRDGLAARIASLGWEDLLAAADESRLSNILALQLGQRGLVPPVPAIQLPDGRLTVPAALAQRLAAHEDIRALQRARLVELVGALNEEGIRPLLLKGARSLINRGPEWRTMRDLDLLVQPEAAAHAWAIARRMGYFERDRAPYGHHHLPNLYRDDLPGWLEFHDRAGVPRLEALMPTRELWAVASASDIAGSESFALPPGLHVLHSMLHHHIGHGGDVIFGLPLKGLYEFATEVNVLDAEETNRLAKRAARHPRLLAIVDLWIAAAAELFGMPVSPPLTLTADASSWWLKRRPYLGSSMEDRRVVRRLELALALQPERLLRVDRPILRQPIPAWVATRWSFVQRPRLDFRRTLRPGPAP